MKTKAPVLLNWPILNLFTENSGKSKKAKMRLQRLKLMLLFNEKKVASNPLKQKDIFILIHRIIQDNILASSPKRAENDCWGRVGCPGSQTFLSLWHKPEPGSCCHQWPACEDSTWTRILPQFNHSFTVSKHHKPLHLNYLYYLKLCQWLRSHCQPLLCCLFSYCSCQLAKSS